MGIGGWRWGVVSGDCARSWLMEGRLLQTLRWRDNFSVRRVAAKVWLAAWLRRADDLETKAVWMVGCRMAGVCRALELAASWLHLAPTSMASTTSGSPEVLDMFVLCSVVLRAGLPPGNRVGACMCAGPSPVREDTKVGGRP